MKNILNGLLFTFLFLLSSCGQEEFGTTKKETNSTTESFKVATSEEKCSDSTLIKPPVDFLFVWDNSSSQFSINQATKDALNNTISLISNRFDYHILLAPLTKYSGSKQYFISTTPLTPSASMGESIIVSNRDNAANHLASFTTAGAGGEAGMQRVVNLLSNNVSNGVFRKNAYTMIIMMSNEDDDSWAGMSDPPFAGDMHTLTNSKFQDLMCLRGNYTGNSSARCSGLPNLDSLMMRFYSMVPHSSNCQSGYKKSFVYTEISKQVYQSPYSNGIASPVGASSTPDSINICNGMNSSIFDGINNSIQDKVIGHKYKYWPVTQNQSAVFNESSIKVVKNTGEEVFPKGSGQNGFSYLGIQTVDTRIKPTVGEPFTGHVIELSGNAQVQYPECLIVTTTTPTDYYGFVHLDSKPLESSISLTINGDSIPKSSTNGWQLVKTGSSPQYIQNKNIKITSPTNYSSATPAIQKTGYFLQVFGTAVYSNGAVINVIYDPSS